MFLRYSIINECWVIETNSEEIYILDDFDDACDIFKGITNYAHYANNAWESLGRLIIETERQMELFEQEQHVYPKHVNVLRYNIDHIMFFLYKCKFTDEQLDAFMKMEAVCKVSLLDEVSSDTYKLRIDNFSNIRKKCQEYADMLKICVDL